MDENNESNGKQSFSQKYISKYIALDVKTIIPLIIFVGLTSFAAYSAFTYETKAALTEIAKACDKNENEVIELREKYKGIDRMLEKMDRTLEKTHDLLIDHIMKTKKSGH